MTAPGNPRFTKVIANRLWKKTMGVGLFEPVDDLKDDTTASNPELMEYLTEKGFHTKAIRDPKRAVEAIRRGPVHLVFLLLSARHSRCPPRQDTGEEPVFIEVTDLELSPVSAQAFPRYRLSQFVHFEVEVQRRARFEIEIPARFDGQL